MARGGYRKPNNPAPVSGPGKLSRRTDGGPGSKQAMQEIRTGKYGESKALAEQQQGAPMAGNPAPAPRVTIPTNQASATQLFEPTQRPNEPVTRGLPFGPGQNTLKSTSPLTSDSSAFAQRYLPSLKEAAYLPEAPDSFKRFVAYLEDVM
jgi:hypothetical protein